MNVDRADGEFDGLQAWLGFRTLVITEFYTVHKFRTFPMRWKLSSKTHAVHPFSVHPSDTRISVLVDWFNALWQMLFLGTTPST